MTSLMVLTLSCVALAQAADLPQVIYVGKGWRSSAPGYWMGEQTGRDILSGWSADQEALAVYRSALEEAQKKVEAADARIAELSKRAKAQARKWPIGLGVFGGVDHHGDGVIGAGLVILIK